ncbi:MAG: NUDIX hydrolase [Chloroflexi bacterium]|nr:NUDIX hydrolase [Chloroflexota bacterium]
MARGYDSRGPVERLTAAGGVVYRRQGDALEIVLCGRLDPLLWTLPKGTPNPGEEIEETAVREVTEETGLDVQIVGRLGDLRYWFTRMHDGVRCNKIVYHYLMVPTGGDFARHDFEFDRVQWFPVEEALRVLTYPNEADVVERAVAALTRTAPAREPGEPADPISHDAAGRA